MQSIYTAAATSTGDGRSGHVRSVDGLVDTDLAAPTEMGGPGGAPNPEVFFAAGYAACFHSALRAAGKQLDIAVEDSAVTAEVSIGEREGGFQLAVVLNVELGGISREEAQRAAELAHTICPYSHATQGNIDVQLAVDVA
ncbi:organic hydroperoxide resistance protein [Arenivirga flava]|uniref:Organic hydroperoxide resistance protein n=1 Tax=Arenivirga flava TaxID=1930060 RepID=A0AA37UIL5_9MICO|nr:organic hydroperoxide resistance protein [Arenivirga flava]GMA29659.1 organic hydroperoxide resistance protein [Arenivirga flava]